MYGVSYDRKDGTILQIESMSSVKYDVYKRTWSTSTIGVTYITLINIPKDINLVDLVINKTNYLINDFGNVVKKKVN